MGNKKVYILTNDSHRDTVNLQKCAINEYGMKKILIEDNDEIGNCVIEETIKFDYEKNKITYQYTDFDGDIEEGTWGFFDIDVILKPIDEPVTKPFRVINNMKNKKLIEGYQPEDKLNTNNPPNEYKVEDLFDWNTLTLEQMVDFLERKYMFLSTGEAKCIMELVRFYQINKK